MNQSFGGAFKQLQALLDEIVSAEPSVDFIGVVRFDELIDKNSEMDQIDDFLAHREISGDKADLIFKLISVETVLESVNPMLYDNMRVGKRAVYRLVRTNRDSEVVFFAAFRNDSPIDANVLRATAKHYRQRVVAALDALPVR